MALDRKIALRIEANTKKAEADVKRLQGQLNRLSKVKIGASATGQLTTGLARVGQQAKRTSTQMDKLRSRINAAFNIAIVDLSQFCSGPLLIFLRRFAFKSQWAFPCQR
jgi:hypothetical protein